MARIPISFGCGFDTMSFQNIRNRRVRQDVTEVCDCALNASITPCAIFLSHTNHQLRNLGWTLRAARIPVRAPIIFLRNQPPMPCEQSFRSDDCGDLRENLTSEPFGFDGKPTSLVVRKTEPTITELFPQNAIFLYEVLDHVLLPLVQPARNGNDEKRKWISRPARIG